ncbi:hypothetical protein HZZ00_37505 (plasmid) [Streptomyces sp. NEAU-sy36]|uniref:hypothetical protein n=1 Tax=unclassified Streptomyces TaxID=2593676 RepID=UPI0015D64798|nr:MULTISPECIES: hypothetical protein [unclassified Streptomyces]QLJ06733.1 hypothetical protein HZZ00_37505 [Streptomyces sp. NEAU-sy36]
MDTAVTHWLLAQLGTDTDLADLTARYTRLGTARAVAIEVLRERYAALRDQPTAVTVTNVVAINQTANLAAYERQIAALEAGEPPAPDDPPCGGPDMLEILHLRARPRR